MQIFFYDYTLYFYGMNLQYIYFIFPFELVLRCSENACYCITFENAKTICSYEIY